MPQLSSESGVEADMKFPLTQAPSRRDWTLLAALGLLVPALLALLKVLILRRTILGGFGLGFVPLDGPVDGVWPHVFYRIMHDLTHPLMLSSYAAVFAYFPFRARTTAFVRVRSLQIFIGVLLVHLVFFFSYCGSIWLPVGDPISIISR